MVTQRAPDTTEANQQQPLPSSVNQSAVQIIIIGKILFILYSARQNYKVLHMLDAGWEHKIRGWNRYRKWRQIKTVAIKVINRNKCLCLNIIYVFRWKDVTDCADLRSALPARYSAHVQQQQQLLIKSLNSGIKPRFHWAVQFGLVQYGTPRSGLRFHCRPYPYLVGGSVLPCCAVHHNSALPLFSQGEKYFTCINQENFMRIL